MAGPCAAAMRRGQEGGRCERGGRRGCECGVWPVELGFLLNLYHGGAIPAVGSGMDGQNQLGHLG